MRRLCDFMAKEKKKKKVVQLDLGTTQFMDLNNHIRVHREYKSYFNKVY